MDEVASGALIPQLQPGQDSDPILQVLRDVFRYSAFRPGQEAVCRAAFEGRDVLVVMPTGSGKSLCFQLPALARGGTALVISPLIALMEDQVAKLNALGLRADRIHSGLGRDHSRATAIAFRDRKLQFLFIAPERLAVPGFPEFLARVKPTLIAIDEAHCISQWGHDFRPDYRMLQHYLPMLRPAPLVALTATATPVVQNDISEQLGLLKPLRSIQGFRRENIAIEVVEVAPGSRRQAAATLLQDPACRPAIVYAPTRNETDALTAELNPLFRTEAYHAGLRPDIRSSVQEQFLRGEIQVMVATVAFGMGIDKPDIRTVIHTALPGSVEAYYQEIGRAGRDGGLSRAILMHSYADRHRHDFFFNRDYPEGEVLQRIYALLRDKTVSKIQLQTATGMDPDAFEKALEKLWVHGGALIDPEENVGRGSASWQDSYLSQSEQRADQLELMLRYASAHRCRMAALVHYFGDRTDHQDCCGMCDFCAPEECLAQTFRDARPEEQAAAQNVLRSLAGGASKSTGRLFSELGSSPDFARDGFEELLGAMARAGLLVLSDAVFEKEGKRIPYRTARLTREGQGAQHEEQSLPLQLRQGEPASAKRKTRSSGQDKAARRTKIAQESEMPVDQAIVQELKRWRLQQAKIQKVPAFCIFSDRVVHQIATELPSDSKALLAIPGVGSRSVERYGEAILKLISGRHRSAIQ